jgi:hypothetical protein
MIGSYVDRAMRAARNAARTPGGGTLVPILVTISAIWQRSCVTHARRHPVKVG